MVLQDPDHAPGCIPSRKAPGWVKSPLPGPGGRQVRGLSRRRITRNWPGGACGGENTMISWSDATDLEKGNRTLAVFNQEMLYPVGWS